MDGLRQVPLTSAERAALLAVVIDAHRQGARPTAETILAALPEELADLGERLREGPMLPPVESAKVAPAVRTIILRLERLAQADRLREQGQLLDQVDSETARTLLASMQDLVASRNEVTQRLMEEQAHYHMG